MKVLLWFVSDDKRFFRDAITVLKAQHGKIEIIDLIIGHTEIIKADCSRANVILVVGGKVFGMGQIIKEVRRFNLPAEKFLGDWIICIPGFTLEKYRELQRSRLSILSRNCFGGLISHTLGLPLYSPFVNMFFKEDEYLKFLRKPQAYMKEQVTLKEMKWNAPLKFDYPVVKLGDIKLYMNHYKKFEDAMEDWNKRKARINWDNLFVTMYTEREESLQEFDALPYEKKVCFVPFKSDLNSAWYINPEIDFDRAETGFYNVVNNFARGKHFYYDPFDMLLYGKKTQLIDM